MQAKVITICLNRRPYIGNQFSLSLSTFPIRQQFTFGRRPNCIHTSRRRRVKSAIVKKQSNCPEAIMFPLTAPEISLQLLSVCGNEQKECMFKKIAPQHQTSLLLQIQVSQWHLCTVATVMCLRPAASAQQVSE